MNHFLMISTSNKYIPIIPARAKKNAIGGSENPKIPPRGVDGKIKPTPTTLRLLRSKSLLGLLL